MLLGAPIDNGCNFVRTPVSKYARLLQSNCSPFCSMCSTHLGCTASQITTNACCACSIDCTRAPTARVRLHTRLISTSSYALKTPRSVSRRTLCMFKSARNCIPCRNSCFCFISDIIHTPSRKSRLLSCKEPTCLVRAELVRQSACAPANDHAPLCNCPAFL